MTHAALTIVEHATAPTVESNHRSRPVLFCWASSVINNGCSRCLTGAQTQANKHPAHRPCPHHPSPHTPLPTHTRLSNPFVPCIIAPQRLSRTHQPTIFQLGKQRLQPPPRRCLLRGPRPSLNPADSRPPPGSWLCKRHPLVRRGTYRNKPLSKHGPRSRPRPDLHRHRGSARRLSGLRKWV